MTDGKFPTDKVEGTTIKCSYLLPNTLPLSAQRRLMPMMSGEVTFGTDGTGKPVIAVTAKEVLPDNSAISYIPKAVEMFMTVANTDKSGKVYWEPYRW